VRRKSSAVAALALVAVISAGCGGTGSSSGRTSTAAPVGITGTTATASTGNGGNENATAREKAVKFAECVRENGVSDFPDPDASGAFTIETIANGSSVDTSSVAFTRALTACKDLEPPGFYGETRSPEQQEAALEFAQCIRDNGVKDFPDPAIDEPLVDTNRIPSSATPRGMDILNAAMQKCRDFGAAAGATGGQ
jgi:hypothetical protein